MLSFSINDGKYPTISIFCDDNGIDRLMELLSRLKTERMDHLHICSSTAGGNDLDKITPYKKVGVSEVILNLFDEKN